MTSPNAPLELSGRRGVDSEPCSSFGLCHPFVIRHADFVMFHGYRQ